MAEVYINNLGGNCPVQATGQINGYGFYFRARGNGWSLEIYTGPNGPWEYWEEYKPEEEHAAGWMDKEEAESFIREAAKRFDKEMNETTGGE